MLLLGRYIEMAYRIMSTEFSLLGFDISFLNVLIFIALSSVVVSLLFGMFK